MGCGNLIFAHDNPFNRETLGPCGYFFASDVDLTEAINLAERERADLVGLRETAISRARANYRWPDIVFSYAALLERLPRS
jgi:glycosyltransferase involved in cell wall biosynthesis